MIAVDTNLLVYAHREDARWYVPAERLVRDLAEGRGAWAIPWPCVHEFLAIVTHPKIYRPPSSLAQATDQIEAWLASPSLVLLGESKEHWPTLLALLRDGDIRGPRVHDARIATLCLQHGVRELWSADRDFGRFPLLRMRNPLVGGSKR